MVARALGACKTRDFEYLQRNRSIVVRGDVSHMEDVVCLLKRALDAEDVEHRSGHNIATS